MIHVRSFVEGKFWMDEGKAMKKLLKIRAEHTHDPRDDVLEVAEEFMKANGLKFVERIIEKIIR